VSHYSRGRNAEWQVRDHLLHHGYAVIRASGSKGAADLVAFTTGRVLFVQVKTSGAPIPPASRSALIALADVVGPLIAIPIVAVRLGPSDIEYWALTGPGPRDRLPWEPAPLAGGVPF
jgi:Holliday junction resolvase